MTEPQGCPPRGLRSRRGERGGEQTGQKTHENLPKHGTRELVRFRQESLRGRSTAEVGGTLDMSRVRIKAAVASMTLAAFVGTAAAQTPVVAPKNKYSPAEDVKLGQQAAQQVEKELPVMRDEMVNSYLSQIGRRLAENIPPEFRHPEFRYT